METPLDYFHKIKEKARTYLSDEDITLIERAFYLAEKAHSTGKKRESGESFIFHPLAVTEYLIDKKMDVQTLCASLLHDVDEDTDTKLPEVEKEFGPTIARLVDGVTKLGQIKPPPNLAEDLKTVFSQAQTFDKMMLASTRDIRVILIKLADRLHNMRTIMALDMPRRRKVVSSTTKIYIPLATRLGIWSMKTEMEDYVIKALDIDAYRQIGKVIQQRAESHRISVTNATKLLSQSLDINKIKGEIREIKTTYYDIYQKSIQANLRYDEIPEIFILSILVDTEEDCYRTLGIVHALWEHIPGKIDDYIATPKENSYRSLHTNVIGPGGRIFKIRIRTSDMDELANYGIFTYWRKPEAIRGIKKPEEWVYWLAQLNEWRNDSGNSLEFIETLLSDVLVEPIYVFTPKGDKINLTKGSTGLDFAYRIHTDIGHSSRLVKINDRIHSLWEPLQNGDQVLVLVGNQIEPNYDWLDPYLDYTNSTYTKRQIRRWFRRLSKSEQISLGEKILHKEFDLFDVKFFESGELLELLGYDSFESLKIAIGSTEVLLSEIIKKYLDKRLGFDEADEKNQNDGLTIKGTGIKKYQLSECCHPKPGEQIIGQVLKNGKLIVHHIECQNALALMFRGSYVQLSWEKPRLNSKPVVIYVDAFDRKQLLNSFTDIIGKENISMKKVVAGSRKKSSLATIRAYLDIESSNQLLRILHRVRQLPNIVKVHTKILN